MRLNLSQFNKYSGLKSLVIDIFAHCCHSSIFRHTFLDQAYWKELANEELKAALRVKWNTNTAKNIILFVGDGMGPNTVTATRIHKGGESHKLVYEKFPHVGLLKV